MANKNKRPETGGLQQKKVKVEPTKEEIKAEKENKREQALKKKKDKKERRGPIKVLRETGSELKKVRWPSFGKTVKQTGVVLAVVVIFSAVVFLFDLGFEQLYKLLTKGLG